MKKILVLRSSRVEHVRECLEELKLRFPDSHICLLVQSQLRDKFSWCDEVMVYHGGMFTFSLWRASSRIIKKLRQQRFDLAVLPTAYANNRTSANVTFFQAALLLFLCRVKKVTYFSISHDFFSTTLAGLIIDNLLELLKVGLAPYYWLKGCLKLCSLRGDVVGLANIPNDLLAHLVKAKWVKKYGLLGLAYDSYLGNPYGLFYPPGSFWLLRVLGVRGFYLLVMLLFTSGFIFLAYLSHNLWFVLLLPYLICSPGFKTNVLIAGRVEPLGWATILLMLIILQAKQYLFCLPILFIMVILIHASPAILGGLSLLVFGILSYQTSAIVISIAIGALATIFWWLPFCLNQNKLCFKELRRLVPILNINRDFFQTELIGSIILCLGLLSGGRVVNLVILLPLLIYCLSIFQNRYLFHLGSLQMWVLTLGAFLVGINPTWLTVSSYLVSLYLYSPFCFKHGFEIKPIRIEPTRQRIEELVKDVPGSCRFGLEFQGRWADDIKWNWIIAYCLADKDYELCSGVSFDQVDLGLITRLEMRINNQEEDLLPLLKQAGVSYVIAFSKGFEQRLRSLGFELIAQTVCSDLGLLKGRDIFLFKMPFEVNLIEPKVELRREKNLIIFQAEGLTNYLLKYNYYGGWRAFQDETRVPLVDASPGMKLKPLQDGEVRLKYRHRYYLLPHSFIRAVRNIENKRVTNFFTENY